MTHHGFINGVSSFVRENAGGQTTDDFLYTEFIADVKNIVVDFHVVSKKVQIGPHVVKQASNLKKGVIIKNFKILF